MSLQFSRDDLQTSSDSYLLIKAIEVKPGEDTFSLPPQLELEQPIIEGLGNIRVEVRHDPIQRTDTCHPPNSHYKPRVLTSF